MKNNLTTNNRILLV